MTVQVLVADDQPLMRSALRLCLDSEPDVEVVAEAADGAQAVELGQRLRPDVALVDIRMPRLDGVAAIRALTAPENGRPVRAIAITTFDVDEHVLDALQAGASGYLLKDATPEQLVQAVRDVAAGNAVLDPAVTKRLLDRYRSRLFPPSAADLQKIAGLTARELDVLKLVARGLSNAELARRLHLAETSVKTHIGHLLTKLALRDRVHLVVFAYESGLVQPGQPDA